MLRILSSSLPIDGDDTNEAIHAYLQCCPNDYRWHLSQCMGGVLRDASVELTDAWMTVHLCAAFIFFDNHPFIVASLDGLEQLARDLMIRCRLFMCFDNTNLEDADSYPMLRILTLLLQCIQYVIIPSGIQSCLITRICSRLVDASSDDSHPSVNAAFSIEAMVCILDHAYDFDILAIIGHCVIESIRSRDNTAFGEILKIPASAPLTSSICHSSQCNNLAEQSHSFFENALYEWLRRGRFGSEIDATLSLSFLPYHAHLARWTKTRRGQC